MTFDDRLVLALVVCLGWLFWAGVLRLLAPPESDDTGDFVGGSWEGEEGGERWVQLRLPII